MTYFYEPRGVCSKRMELDIEGGIIKDARIDAGCDGNLKGIVTLIKGRPAIEVAELLRGIRCERKSTSCPDQLAHAIELALTRSEEEVAVE